MPTTVPASAATLLLEMSPCRAVGFAGTEQCATLMSCLLCRYVKESKVLVKVAGYADAATSAADEGPLVDNGGRPDGEGVLCMHEAEVPPWVSIATVRAAFRAI